MVTGILIAIGKSTVIATLSGRNGHGQELFISSTAGGLMPVSKVDGQSIDASPIGPLTTRLRDLYWSKRRDGWHTTAIEYRTA